MLQISKSEFSHDGDVFAMEKIIFGTEFFLEVFLKLGLKTVNLYSHRYEHH